MNIDVALKRVILNSTDILATKYVYESSLEIAKVYIRKKVNRGTLDVSLIQLPLEDLASETIAEMFGRDEHNNFKYFQNYQEFSCLDKKSDVEIALCFKRFVITKVKDGLFNLFRYNDPELSRIIRNLKVYIKNSDKVELNLNAEVVFCDEDFEGLPDTYFEHILVQVLKTNGNFSDLIEEIAGICKESEYSFKIHISQLALSIRSCMKKFNTFTVSDDSVFKDVAKKDLEKLIERSIKKIEAAYYRKYVETDKLSKETFYWYLESIKKMYSELMKHGDSAKIPIFHYMSEIHEPIDQEIYRRDHRTVVEYLLKVSKEQIKQDFLSA